jgi:hypothetical protein
VLGLCLCRSFAASDFELRLHPESCSCSCSCCRSDCKRVYVQVSYLTGSSSIIDHEPQPETSDRSLLAGRRYKVFKYIGYLVVRPSKFLAATIPGPGTYLHITKFELSRSRSGARVMIEFLPLPAYDVPLVLPTLLIARVQNVYSRYSG